MKDSTVEVDLRRGVEGSRGSKEPLSLEQIRQQAQELISRRFADALPEMAENLLSLAKTAEKEDVRLRATIRVLGQFEEKAKQSAVGGTTVQIMQNFQVPETLVVGGKEAPVVELAGSRIALPEKPKRVILPEEGQVKRASYLGPKTATGLDPSPAPRESETKMPAKL